jgi:hypothetical protein
VSVRRATSELEQYTQARIGNIRGTGDYW